MKAILSLALLALSTVPALAEHAEADHAREESPLTELLEPADSGDHSCRYICRSEYRSCVRSYPQHLCKASLDVCLSRCL